MVRQFSRLFKHTLELLEDSYALREGTERGEDFVCVRVRQGCTKKIPVSSTAKKLLVSRIGKKNHHKKP